MKLKYIFTALVAGLALLSCQKEEPKTHLDEVQVSSSYVAIDQEGGSTVITVNATAEWNFTGAPEWLNIEPLSGAAGEDIEVTFSADKTIDGRTATLLLNCDGKSQYINVIQGLPVISPATCAEVINGIEGKTYLVTGVCTSIANTKYGNFYLNDGTGELYIYGTVNGKGEYDWSSFGIEVGDEVTVQGARVTYGSTIEFMDALFISVNKSLIKVDSTVPETPALGKEGGELTVNLVCKGKGVSVEIPEAAQDWLSISAIDATNNVVTFRAAENLGGDRSVTVVFKTTDGKKDYTAELTISQEGSILEVSIADFLAAEVGETQYRLTGVVTKVANTNYGNVYLKDWSGETYVYGFSNWSDYKETLKAGDIVTLVGKRADYKGSAQVGNAVLEKLVSVKTVTIAEFNALPDSKTDYYMVTGTVSSIKKAEYGNLYITDGTNELYVYGCYPGYGAPKGDAQKGFLAKAGIEVGDKLTMIGYKDTYNGTIELCGGTYFSHEKASADATYSIALPYVLGSNAYDDGLATVNGTKDLKTVKIGSSKASGDFTITVPAGTKKLVFNAVAWKGTTAVVTLKAADAEIGKIENVAGNDGATGLAPYTITVEKDTYTFSYDFKAETKVNITSDNRVVFYGIKAE